MGLKFEMSAMTCKAQTLRDIVTLEKGKPPAQQPYFGYDAELYLTPEYLRGRGTAEPVKASLNAVRVLDGDTIVLWDGSNAGEFFRARRGILASTMSRISHDDTFDKEYFFYAVKYWESFLKGQTSGSGIPHVDKEIFGKIEVFKFLKPEQTKIAEILSTVDRVIELMEALIAKQQRIKTGLMQDLLTRGIDEHGDLRSEQTHQFKDSQLGRIPVEWEVLPISLVLAQPPKNGYSPVESTNWNGIYMLGLGCLTNDGFRPKQLKYAPKVDSSIEAARLHDGDFLISRSNTRSLVGLVGIYRDIGESCIYPDLMGASAIFPQCVA